MKVNKSELKKVVGSILGGEEEKELDFPSAFSKFSNMKKHSMRFKEVFGMLGNNLKLLDELPDQKEIFKSYANLISDEIETTFNQYDIARIEKYVPAHPIIPKEAEPDILEFLKYYSKMKNSKIVNTMIKTCSELIIYKKYLGNKNNLNPAFLTKSSQLTMELVVDLPINFKLLYHEPCFNDYDRQFLLNIIHKIYEITKDMYEEYCKVDIDTNAFVQAVHITVEKLKKKIPRCEEAFKKILDSTEMLQDKYDEYYKDYIGCGNSSIIAENFIHDVAGNVEKSPKLAMQFKRIIKYLRDMTHGLKDLAPKQKDTFDTLFTQAEQNYVDYEEDDDDEE